MNPRVLLNLQGSRNSTLTIAN